ncbi:hypothetical protein FRB93_003404 [Tulasnella sp. JGI-2019a]|nr:hypothetical protein FRB93_003404 [Tulasnella sp. JGI-2019a]
MHATIESVLALLFLFALSATAQTSSSITVPLNSSQVVISQNGVPLSRTYLQSDSVVNAGYYDLCGGAMVLDSTVNSAATMIFNGTAIQVEFLLGSMGGDTNLYLDGVFWETVSTYAAENVTACDIARATNVNLSQEPHNITVINANIYTRTHILNFVYTPYIYVAPTSALPPSNAPRSATPTPQPTPPATQSNNTIPIGPIIGGVIGLAILLTVIVGAAIFMIRQRRSAYQHHAAPTHTSGDPGPTIQVTDEYKYVRPGSVNIPQAPYVPISNSSYPPPPVNLAYSSAPPPPAPVSESSQPTTIHGSTAPFFIANGSGIEQPQPMHDRSSIASRTPASQYPSFPRPHSVAVLEPSYIDHQQHQVSQADLQRMSALSQVDLVQQLVNRGVPTAEITSMIRMMADASASGSAAGVGGMGSEPVEDEAPPPVYGDEKAGLRGQTSS